MALYKVDSDTADLTKVAGGTLYADAPLLTVVNSYDSVAAPGWARLTADVAERTLSRTEYKELFDLVTERGLIGAGKPFGVGNGSTTFVLPDLRGEFIRGTGTNSHTNQGSGGTVGQHQDATNILRMNTYATDLYTFIDTRSDRGVYGNNFDSESSNDGYIRTSAAANILTSYTSTPSVGGTVTTRPTNTSLNYFMKVKQVAIPTDFLDAVFDEVNKIRNTQIVVGTPRTVNVQGTMAERWSANLPLPTIPDGKKVLRWFAVVLSQATNTNGCATVGYTGSSGIPTSIITVPDNDGTMEIAYAAEIF